MNCPKCKAENPEGAQFCSICGNVLMMPQTATGPTAIKTSRLAIATLILGILSLVTCSLTAIPSIICGIISLVRIEKSGGRLTGKGFSIVGIVLPLPVLFFTTLVLLLIPALNNAKEQAIRQACLARIRQQGLTLELYANENNGKFPLPGNAFYWLQDIDCKTVNYMLDCGMTREMFYCPSNQTHQKYNDLFWEYANDSWDSRIQRFTRDSGYICSGYCFILDSTSADRGPIVRYKKDSLEPKWIRTISESQAASRELIVDSIMAQRQASGTPYGYDFQNIQGGIYGQAQVYDTSSHLKGQYEPSGGNVWYLDQHGEWRPFEPDMDGERAVGRYGGNGSPYFFW